MANRWLAGLWCILMLWAFLASGCEERPNPGLERELGTDEKGAGLCSIQDAINYSEHISNVLNKNCVGCHSSSRTGVDRDSAPLGVDFDGPEGAQQSAEAANRKIQAGEMPPSAPLGGCEQEAFRSWVESGSPR